MAGHDQSRTSLPERAGDSSRFDGYFAHKPPFKALKSRQDLPDAFIVEGLRSYAAKASKPVRFIVKDRRLADAARAVPNVDVHEDLLDLLAKINVERAVTLGEMRRFCKSRSDDIIAAVREQLLVVLNGFEVEDLSFPSDNHEATIASSGEIGDVDLEFGDTEVFGSDLLAISFGCVVDECLLDLFVYKGDFGSIDDRKYSVSHSDWNDHYMLLQTYRGLAIEARVLVRVVPEASPGIEKHVLKIEKIEVDVTEVQVQEEPAVKPSKRGR